MGQISDNVQEKERIDSSYRGTLLPGDFGPGDHRGARPKVLQSFAGPFRTP